MATSKVGKRHKPDPPFPKKSADDTKDEEGSQNIIAELKALRSMLADVGIDVTEIKSELADMREDVTQFQQRLQAIEDKQSGQQATIKELQVQVKKIANLERELEDANLRSRRNNLRIWGVPEGMESTDMIKYLESFIPKILDITFDKPLEIDRAHQVPSHKLTNARYPRPIVFRLLRYSQIPEIMARARVKSPLKRDGYSILFVPDLSKKTAQLRKQMLAYRPKLKELNAKYGMMYPARMRVTLNNNTKDFTEPSALADFIEEMSPSSIDAVNGTRSSLPISLSNGRMRVQHSGGSVVVSMDNQINVYYNWESHLLIQLDSRYSEKLCGMCGNYNNDPTDDFKTPSGSLTSDPTEFGKSWKVEDGDNFCWHDCSGVCKPCPPDQLRKYKSEDYCGLITKTTSGPFIQCHAKVDPKVYFENCAYDVCMNDGFKKILCQALKLYADTCQRHGVTISEWRKTAGCPFECTISNSQYKFCGSACPVTCEDLSAPTKCTDSCVETCECAEGFVLSQGQCILKSDCGCIFEGRPYAQNATFWADNSCEKRCFCHPVTKEVKCSVGKCGSTEQCGIVNGIRGCYSTTYAVCSAAGDPHYYTFDRYRFNFQGTCVYLFSGLCSNRSDLVDFQVLVENDHRGSDLVSYTKNIYLKVYNTKIEIQKKHSERVMVNGLLYMLPLSINNGQINIHKEGFNAVCKIDFGLKITFDWNSLLTLTLPSSYSGEVCGFCGNFNGNDKDDLLLKNGSPAPNLSTFGESWMERHIQGCVNNENPECPDMDAAEKRQRVSKTDCGILLDQNGPFRECHSSLDPESYFKDCVYDSCFFKGWQHIICEVIAAYAAGCQEANATVHSWRRDNFCPVNCPANSHYELCTSGCSPTCFNLSPPPDCSTHCREGCACDKGFILSGDQCVPISQCGCVYKGFYYKINETFYPSENCSQQCICHDGGIQCMAISCGPNEECTVVDGVLKCQPISSATCVAYGDPHYYTYDGFAYDFQGNCTYTLTKPCPGATGIPAFEVNVKNEKWGKGKVSVTKTVSFHVYKYNMILRHEQPLYVEVYHDDELKDPKWNGGNYYTFPFTLQNGRIHAYMYGINAVIITDTGLKVTYNFVGGVTVNIPGNYRENMCGLCGNYNGDKNDDFRLPDGTKAPDPTTFGLAWMVYSPNMVCDHGCGDPNNPCPVCDEDKKEFFKSNEYCGLLKDSNGPLKDCHSIFNPDKYFDDCIYDLCMGNGKDPIHCNNIQMYVTMCQAAGVNITSWRSEFFCPLTCPENSSYKNCAHTCSTSCAVFWGIEDCPETCAEGCECNNGFFFNGERCVPMEECGCYENGRTYKLHEKVWSYDCNYVCECSTIKSMICELSNCSDDNICEIRDGIRGCYPKDPCSTKLCKAKEYCQVNSGRAECIPQFTAECWAWGEPHYCTLDNNEYDFQGTCTYTFVEYDGSDPTLIPFTVDAKNDNRGSQEYSYVCQVTIRTLGHQIIMKTGQFPQIIIDGIMTNLPVTVDGGSITVVRSGIMAIVETYYGLTVGYDWNIYLDVTVPSSYYNVTRGLCGNFNGDAEDDMTYPNGTHSSSIIEWAASWQVNDRDPFCFHNCPSVCPSCEESERQLYGSEQFCGLINQTTNGPFQKCHALVNPDTFFDNCVYDVCMNKGAKIILCQALNAYATNCQKQGANISDWRIASGCSLPCPENSHYESCGNACPATCSDREAPSKCEKPCVETCQCNDGYIVSGSQCVSEENCGCTYGGVYYLPNEEFWSDANCHVRCKCNSSTGMVVCYSASCKTSERCAVVHGVRSCYSISYSTCIAYGYHHYITFDGVKYDYQGGCNYLFAGTNSQDPSLTPFRVTVQNDYQMNRAVTFTKAVTLELYNQTITISKDYCAQIQFNGVITDLPFSYSKEIRAFRSGVHVYITSSCGITVIFDCYNYVQVIAPDTYANAVSGLCGNNNNNQTDDMITKDGILTANATEFGNSWKVGGVPGCEKVCPSEICPLCTEAEKSVYRNKTLCGKIIDANGPFSQCHATIDPAPFFNNCVFDSCQFKGRLSVLCNGIASYVSQCQAKGIQIQEWRTPSFCALTCSKNSHYELCGSGCPTTCLGLSPPAGCDAHCAEGCACDSGYILSGNECALVKDCGCTFKGSYFRKGDVFYPDGLCEQQCMCADGGLIECQTFSCDANEECKVVDGVQGCHPVGVGKCTAVGDPHYSSFDRRLFDFQGICQYVLVEATCKDRGWENFSIVVENEPFGTRNVSVISKLLVSIDKTSITFERGKEGTVLVNGEKCNLPVYLDSRRISINREGINIILSTKCGFMVLYDTIYYVEVTVPSTFKNKTRGLCGNYNDDMTDDFTKQDGSITPNPDDFGEDWKVKGSGVKCGGCGDNCPSCDLAKEQEYASESTCGLIRDPEGPFKDCHAHINPEPFVTYCTFDMCAVNGSRDILCQSLQAYTAACQAAGASISTWRQPSFCPLSCPLNSHYEQCTRTCDFTCAGINGPSTCTGQCFEGCECNPGYFWDRESCVTEEHCGCVDSDGRYLKLHEKVWSYDCNHVCECSAIKSMICELSNCSDDNICEIRDGIRGCYPKDPCSTKLCKLKEYCQVNSGRAECIPQFTAECWAWGEPHYCTLDNNEYDFQGTCTYTFVEYDGSDPTLIPFTVDAKNDNRGSQEYSYVCQVTIRTLGHQIIMKTGQFPQIIIDGIMTNLPVTVDGGSITVVRSGIMAIVETYYGLTVWYDWNMYLDVTVPSSYYNVTRGLCGNFNGDAEDDMTYPNGTHSSSIIEWAASWQVNDRDPFCFHNCPSVCPSCEESERQLYGSEQFCGLINQTTNGPFQKCHALVNPDTFFDNCVYDVCMNKGAKIILCQALNAYATNCQKQGANISDWRKASGCSLPCPENSHYESCGNACPATCSDREAPSKCEKPCVETCQCNDGYIVSGSQCVSEENCGCTYGGVYYLPNEEFWSDANCHVRCKCNSSTGMVVCYSASCKTSERCAVVHGVRSCYPISYSTCIAYGYHHYITFDGVKYDYQGGCNYLFAGTNSQDPSLTPFRVTVQNDYQMNRAVTFTKAVTLELYNQTITISKDYCAQIQFNGVITNLPFSYSKEIRAFRSGVHVYITSSCGITVIFDCYNYVQVIAPDTYANAVSGLCGNNNNNQTDDMITKDGILTANATEFGNSWKVGGVPGCEKVCPSEICPLCTEAEKSVYRNKTLCGKIIDANGPFSQCHAIIDPAPFFNNCVFDSCQFKGRLSVLCNGIASYVSQCQAKGIQIQEWRTPSFCALTCSKNSHYELCGSGCPTTCLGLSPPAGCDAHCAEGCACDSGYILSGNECALVKDCGCTFKGSYFRKGDVFYPDGLCEQQCMCADGGLIECQTFSCDANEECKVVDGVQGCHPVGVGKCTAVGDPHYSSFDRRLFDFQGICQYVLVEATCKDRGWENFSIVVENEPFGTRNVSVISKLLVSIDKTSITFERGKEGTVLVNGEKCNLPVYLDSRRISINREGINIILSTKCGFMVLYDTIYYVEVTVPSTFKNKTRGLCGNYNDDMTDDFTKQDGSITPNPDDFGEDWKVKGSGVKCGGCGDNCPSCDLAKEQEYASESTCGLIRDPEGPFKDCHAHINPEPFVTYCTFDMCAVNGSRDILCQSLQAYTAACQAAGASISTWRQPSFCPLSCPLNSHYEQCTRTCDFTCAGINGPSTCTGQCFEGCECNPGYFWDRESCVTEEHCGCMDSDGRYLKH
uniref:IgGFc-binding protein-like n=1 Tax=Geotrypetes seraphini TaxID=260995 RepID=A0A6P8SVQ7_GEOSA|nr:IgGFc-binding protein-like [Geotrypetes seraphini]